MLYYDDIVLASCVCCPKESVERESSPIFAPFFSLCVPNINISMYDNT